MTDSLIKNSFIEIPYTEKTYPQNLWNEYKFATLYVEIDDIVPISEPQTIIFSIDISGSMSDVCKDGRTKMQHIIHTTKNIIDVFSKEILSDISVEIWGFDDKLEQIIKKTKCTNETRKEMHDKLTESLHPRGSTNISIALKNANERMTEKNTTHVFMTDGQITNGPKNADQLKIHVNPNYSNIFVGFGSDHDAFLLQSLANQGSYYYVDHIETAGLAYGEITHSILYQALKNVTITIQNGEIYDYHTNSWSNIIKIPLLVGEAKKTFHLRSHDPKNLKATIQSQQPNLSEEIDILPELENAPPIDFTKYLYRQRTLELLYEAQEIIKSEQKKIQDYTRKSFLEIEKKLNDFLIDIKSYIDQNNLREDSFMADLSDDIGITLTTLKTSGLNIAAAYSAGRARSNGTQGSFQPVLRRTRNMTDESNYIPLSTPLSRTNTSARQIRIMETLSQLDDWDQ